MNKVFSALISFSTITIICSLGCSGLLNVGANMAGYKTIELSKFEIARGSRVMVFNSQPGFSGYDITPLADKLEMPGIEIVSPETPAIYSKGFWTPRKMFKDMMTKTPSDLAFMITLSRMPLEGDIYIITVIDSSGQAIGDTQVRAKDIGAEGHENILAWLKANLNVK